MVKLQKNSKRQTLKQKYAIIKKVSAHKKKLKKIIKKTNIHNRRNTKKSLKIPECIFKKNILENIKNLSLNKKKKKDVNNCAEIHINHLDDTTIKNIKYFIKCDISTTENEQNIIDDENTQENKKNKINKKEHISDEYIYNLRFSNYINLDFIDKMKIYNKIKECYYKNLNEKYIYVDNLLDVIKNCDVVFYVIDIRNPLIYLDKDIINFINSCKKQIIIILNKCDLIDNGIIEQWLAFFRTYFLTLPFISFVKKSIQPSYLVTNKSNERNYKTNNNNYNNITMNNKMYNTKNCPIKNIIENISKNNQITYGVIGHIYTGRNSFINTILKEFNYINNIKKEQIDINLSHNINLYVKPGLILKKELNNLQLIKKLHVLKHEEIITLLEEFLLTLTGKNLIRLMNIIKENELANKFKEMCSNDTMKQLDKSNNKLQIKKYIIHSYLYQKNQQGQLHNQINFKNMKTLYHNLFMNKIFYYVIPKSKINCDNQNGDTLKYFSTPLHKDLYYEVDKFVYSQKKPYTDYIIIKSDKYNFYN
ncbi:nucleolar preribosomal GTPase, putative [Plasmodium sp. gorilla clade G3]|nr:nucleolar preribosomal GTPase, putative [Plasmodium sp. gorilla clade G3]